MAAEKLPFHEKLGLGALVGFRWTEQPGYQVVQREKNKEIRLYERFTLASVTVHGPHPEASAEAIQRLSLYFSGANRGRSPLATTTPVFQEEQPMRQSLPYFRQEDVTGWTLSFTLPRPYSSVSAPVPQDPGIFLYDCFPQMVASLAFRGRSTPGVVHQRTAELFAWLSDRSEYRPSGETRAAIYQTPHGMPFFRRYEVQVPVQSLH